MGVDTRVSGPLFDGTAERELAELVDDIEQEGARRLADDVQNELGVVLRDPSGYYRSKVTYDRVGSDWRVHDQRVVYGSWLEGTSRRNRTTRFKGYSTFRRMAQRFDGDLARIAEDEVDGAVRRWNG